MAKEIYLKKNYCTYPFKKIHYCFFFLNHTPLQIILSLVNLKNKLF